MQLETLFTEMADALRTKEETTSKISAESFPQRIKDLKVLDTTDSTATANDLLLGRIAYANGKRIIGTILNNGELEYTPSDEEQIIPPGLTSGGIVKAINSEELVIAPTTDGQVKEGLFNKVTVRKIEAENLVITPSQEEQNFTGLFGNVTVEPSSGGIDTSDATATAGDILLGKTAYVNGKKIIGSFKGTEVVVSSTEPTGENRKAVWFQKGKNLFDKNNPCRVGSLVEVSTGKIIFNDLAFSIYIKIKPNTTYTISKKAGRTFRIATTEQLPKWQTPYIMTTANHTGTSLTITTENNANYLFVTYFSTANGEYEYEEDALRESVQIEESSTATGYEEYIEPKLYVLNENNEYKEIK